MVMIDFYQQKRFNLNNVNDKRQLKHTVHEGVSSATVHFKRA